MWKAISEIFPQTPKSPMNVLKLAKTVSIVCHFLWAPWINLEIVFKRYIHGTLGLNVRRPTPGSQVTLLLRKIVNKLLIYSSNVFNHVHAYLTLLHNILGNSLRQKENKQDQLSVTVDWRSIVKNQINSRGWYFQGLPIWAVVVLWDVGSCLND